MDRPANRGQATRRRIVAAATRLFTSEGYEATSIGSVLEACGVSRGALYHHFASKEALFTAVLEFAEAHVAATAAAAAQRADNPLDALRAGCAAWLDLARDPMVRRVVLLDAPSVIGWEAWREMDGRYGLGLLKAGFGLAAEAGWMRTDRVDIYAHVLLAALIEVALLIARAEDAAAATQAGRQAIEQVLSSLIGVKPDAPG